MFLVNTAIDATSALAALLNNFINKLLPACKGTDILLDNKLTNLKSALKNSLFCWFRERN
ncbi:hypothetical protein [Colwellia sp. C1TZA3]|uniref:hypothetical protein n=1 Tax=Colwellia sp. C1TZA3 TaxID=2508879 RepID=UPI0011B97E46|nr:hypothetical protein [Colwellia sp. C1TZA3]TWX73912.1 hypothetical protein ESZ39_01955 [Colwellia sp. C1TZA3]